MPKLFFAAAGHGTRCGRVQGFDSLKNFANVLKRVVQRDGSVDSRFSLQLIHLSDERTRRTNYAHRARSIVISRTSLAQAAAFSKARRASPSCPIIHASAAWVSASADAFWRHMTVTASLRSTSQSSSTCRSHGARACECSSPATWSKKHLRWRCHGHPAPCQHVGLAFIMDTQQRERLSCRDGRWAHVFGSKYIRVQSCRLKVMTVSAVPTIAAGAKSAAATAMSQILTRKNPRRTGKAATVIGRLCSASTWSTKKKTSLRGRLCSVQCYDSKHLDTHRVSDGRRRRGSERTSSAHRKWSTQIPYWWRSKSAAGQGSRDV